MQAVEAHELTSQKIEASRACVLNYCLGSFGAAYNTMLAREILRIDSSYLIDCSKWCFFPCCTAVQEWREVMLAKKGDDGILIWNVMQINFPIEIPVDLNSNVDADLDV